MERDAPGGATMFNVSNNSRESSNELNDWTFESCGLVYTINNNNM